VTTSALSDPPVTSAAETRRSGRVGVMSRSSAIVHRVLEIEGALNVRDLGGLPVEGGGTTQPMRLIRSDGPHRLTDGGLAALAGLGVRTVVDLRTSSERLTRPSRLGQLRGVTVVAAPIFTDDDPMPDPPPVLLGDVYRWWIDDRRDRICAALSAIASAPIPPVLVHCHAGKDRTGVVVALILRLAGVPADVVADDYAHSAIGLHEFLDKERHQRLERGENPDVVERVVSVRRETMLDALDHVDRHYGGVAAYVGRAGLDDGQIDRLRALMLGGV
jgi:protein-tyrosine phosphatase